MNAQWHLRTSGNNQKSVNAAHITSSARVMVRLTSRGNLYIWAELLPTSTSCRATYEIERTKKGLLITFFSKT